MIHNQWFGIWGPTIGIDLGNRVVKVCQRAADGWRTLAITRERPGAFTPDEVGRIVRAMARHGFTGTRAAISVPQSSLLSARASTPRENSGAPIEEIARQELARNNAVDPTNLLTRSWSARSRRSRGELDERQVFGCTAEIAYALHHAFAEHGVDTVAIEPGPVAAARGALEATRNAPGTGLVVDLGWASARLIAAESQRLVYERSVADLGIQTLAAQIANACSFSEQHAWTIGGLIARPKALDGMIAANRVVIGVIERFADQLMIEIERGVAFAGERYAVNIDHGVIVIGGGAAGRLGTTLATVSGGQLVLGGDQSASANHAVARGLAMITEEPHASRQSAA